MIHDLADDSAVSSSDDPHGLGVGVRVAGEVNKRCVTDLVLSVRLLYWNKI